ncbi:hypothetical protein BO71DRAFT_309710, partial [Aspergillus ellipticus CBS 707.79]
SPTTSSPPPPPPPQPTSTSTTTLPVQTHHCAFCSHLLLASTRSIPTLPRRKDPAKDSALILPLPRDASTTATATTTSNNTSNSTSGTSATHQKHYTILLSTTIPDRKPTLVRREDGFEKRLFLRCGRCRVVVGYFLDPVHFSELREDAAEGEREEEGEDGDEETARVVYLLPGALMETGSMMEESGREKGRGNEEWRRWLEG